MPVCLPGVCRLLSNGASIYPSRVLVPLPCHAGMNVAAKVRQMSLKCSPVLPSEVFRLGIINPWKGLNVPSCGCVAFLHGKMQCAASSIAVRCIGHRTALHFLKQNPACYPPPHFLNPIRPFHGVLLPAGFALQTDNSPAERSEGKSRLSPSSCCQSLSE